MTRVVNTDCKMSNELNLISFIRYIMYYATITSNNNTEFIELLRTRVIQYRLFINDFPGFDWCNFKFLIYIKTIWMIFSVCNQLENIENRIFEFLMSLDKNLVGQFNSPVNKNKTLWHVIDKVYSIESLVQTLTTNQHKNDYCLLLRIIIFNKSYV